MTSRDSYEHPDTSTIYLEKPRAKKRIEIVTDPNESWFLHVRRIEKSTGKVASSSMIIRKDLEDWMTSLVNHGWIIKDSD